MFIPHQYNDGQVDPFVLLPASAGLKLAVGTALKLSSGTLAIASGTDNVQYICMEDRADTASSGQLVHCIAVEDDTIYETSLSAAISSIAPGSTYQIDSTGMMLTASTGGACRVVSADGTQAGSTAKIQFVPVA